MDLYICDFMKNKDCSGRGCGCVYFGGTCSCTTKKECEMAEEDIKGLPAADFVKMHRAVPEQKTAELIAKEWYWTKLMESLAKTGWRKWGDFDEKEQSS